MQSRRIYARLEDSELVHRVVVRFELLDRVLVGEPTDSTHRATLRWECSYCFTSSGSPTIFGARGGGLSGLELEFER
jgi:hypothetical protein